MKEKNEKRQEIEKLTGEANTAKNRLMKIRDELEELGAIRKAKSLGVIIGKLEHWQNH